MELKAQTILITGGSSGIGLELARQLVKKQNHVIICGRSGTKLCDAKAQLPGVSTLQCDIASSAGRGYLIEYLQKNHPDCNVLINNAAIVHKTNFLKDENIEAKAIAEIETNLIAPIALTRLFIAEVTGQRAAAIINITTGLVYTPRAIYPIYNATKAGLHSFTIVLREQLKGLPFNVIEVMMPVVNTPWHNGEVPAIAISPEKAVDEMIMKVEKGNVEIRVGAVKILYILSRIWPAFAFRKINSLS